MIVKKAGIYAEQATGSVVWTFPKYLPHGPIPDAWNSFELVPVWNANKPIALIIIKNIMH